MTTRKKPGPKPTVRVPFAPLAEFCASRANLDDKVNTITTVGLIQRATGTDRTVIRRWQQRGVMLWTADRLACGLGVHPTTIWPDWYELTAETDTKESRRG